MCPGDLLPAGGVAHIDPRAHDVLERAAERADAGRDLVQDVDGLRIGIARADHLAAAVGRRRAADQDAVAGADRPAVAADRLPHAAGIDVQPVGAAGGRRHAVDRRKAAQMMAEVAGRGQERRAPVLVAAVAGNAPGVGQRRVDPRMVLGIEREA